MTIKSWVQIDGKLIPKDEYRGDNTRQQHHVMPDIKPFVSPITGELISSRPHLKAHNKQHGVTNTADYSREFTEKKRNEREARQLGATSRDRADRIEAIKSAMRRS
jgi:hypothetical protein